MLTTTRKSSKPIKIDAVSYTRRAIGQGQSGWAQADRGSIIARQHMPELIPSLAK